MHAKGKVKMEKSRDSNFELLRIVLAFMIIILHYFCYELGGALGNIPNNTINYYFAYFIESACIIAVNVFILMTGYYMHDKSEIKISKVLKLIYLTTFYGILFLIINVLYNDIIINTKNIKFFMTAIIDRWFIIIYIILYLLIPYINKLIKELDKNNFENLLAILLLFFYIWPTFWTKTTILDKGYGIVNFITLYLTGAYIKIYYNNFNSFKKSSLIYFLCTCITAVLGLINKNAFDYNSIFNFISAIALFEMFKAIKIKNCKTINKLATYTLSTYIIHENHLIVVGLYKNMFKTPNYYNSKYLIIHLFITTIGIYSICVLLEWIRRLIMKKHIDNNIDKIKCKIKV